ncbi:NUZM, NADH-ubiquinone oxidoreductase 21.3 kDa subunit [Dentipellis sp. KUC8613]|nr:NUZM, NADH-ubiquinone oxidoreductase 21.3 kDa subunit [Dentipellis sp. KUC8613]
MATKKAADQTLYHLAPKGFWKKFRDAVVVNPEISSGLPLQAVNRQPPPGSRPEKYSTPATKASDIAQNHYWKRDVRRAYPQLSVVTQSQLSNLLIQHNIPQAVAAPSEGEKAEGDKASVPAAAPTPSVDLTEAINTVLAARPTFSETNIPPALPTAFKKWVPERAPDAPHDPNAYFPMLLVK